MISIHTVRTKCVPSGTRLLMYQEALAGRSTDDLHTYCTYQVRCVPSGTLLFIPVYVLYQDALAGRSMDDLQTYCTYQVRTQWYTTVHLCMYCTKKFLLGRAWMIYRHTVCTVPSAYPVAGLTRCLLWCRVESRLLNNTDPCIIVHSNFSAGPCEMLLEGTLLMNIYVVCIPS